MCEARFRGSNPVRSIFFPSSFFFLTRECNSIEGCCLCCSINFYSWDVFFLACMSVRQLLRNRRAIVKLRLAAVRIVISLQLGVMINVGKYNLA